MVLVGTIIVGLEFILVTKSNVLELIIMKILHLRILYGAYLKGLFSVSHYLNLHITKLKNVSNN